LKEKNQENDKKKIIKRMSTIFNIKTKQNLMENDQTHWKRNKKKKSKQKKTNQKEDDHNWIFYSLFFFYQNNTIFTF
jgi:hypothetical protein